MEKMKLTDTQMAFAYANYMMVGSYFSSAECTHSLQEKKMRFQYTEQKTDKQYQMEDICLRFIKQDLLPKLPERVWQQNMKVHFITDAEGKVLGVRFSSPEYILCVTGQYKGRKTQMNFELWVKEQPGPKKKSAKKQKKVA